MLGLYRRIRIPWYAQSLISDLGSYAYYEDGVRVIETKNLPYRVLGLALIGERTIIVRKWLEGFLKEMVKLHEKLHLRHPNLSEYAIRALTKALLQSRRGLTSREKPKGYEKSYLENYSKTFFAFR